MHTNNKPFISISLNKFIDLLESVTSMAAEEVVDCSMDELVADSSSSSITGGVDGKDGP